MATDGSRVHAWWQYQKERFPLLAHGLLIAAFSLSILGYTRQLLDLTTWPDPGPMIAAFVSSLALFFLLRVADEFKDLEDDTKFRSYRPVPRGLISLRELSVAGAIMATLQLLCTLLYQPQFYYLLLALWAYFLLMSREFFIHDWLKRHPLSYMLSHMLIMPLLIVHISAYSWDHIPLEQWRPMTVFLLLGFVNGMVLEVGRKIRAPQDEETGVETYSALWGPAHASRVWLGLLILSALLGIIASHFIGRLTLSAIIQGLLSLLALALVLRFIRSPHSGKSIENMAGVWILISYLHLGLQV